MSEAELHVLKARLRGGIINKVRRGEYRCPCLLALSMTRPGTLCSTPTHKSGKRSAHFFKTFSRVGSASQTVKVFRKRDLFSRPGFARRHDCFPATDGIDGAAHAEQSTIRGCLCVWTAAIPPRR